MVQQDVGLGCALAGDDGNRQSPDVFAFVLPDAAAVEYGFAAADGSDFERQANFPGFQQGFTLGAGDGSEGLGAVAFRTFAMISASVGPDLAVVGATPFCCGLS